MVCYISHMLWIVAELPSKINGFFNFVARRNAHEAAIVHAKMLNRIASAYGVEHVFMWWLSTVWFITIKSSVHMRIILYVSSKTQMKSFVLTDLRI